MQVLHLSRFKVKSLARVQAGHGINPSSSDVPEPKPAFIGKYHVDRARVKGRYVFTMRPREKVGTAHILYLHGGAYSANFMAGHWEFMAYLLDHARCTITAPDYPLLPQATYRDGFAMIEQVYSDLLADIPANTITLMGDSAGGGLALALAQKLALDHAAQPHQIILLSPWLDVALTNPDIAKVADRDPLLSVEALQILGRQWAGSADLSHYQVSPLHGNPAGLGKVSLFTGAADVLNPDARKLKALFDAQNIPLDYFEYAGMMHCWVLFPMPEAMHARRQILSLLRN